MKVSDVTCDECYQVVDVEIDKLPHPLKSDHCWHVKTCEEHLIVDYSSKGGGLSRVIDPDNEFDF